MSWSTDFGNIWNDGYQFGDILKSLGAGAKNIVGSVLDGVTGSSDGADQVATGVDTLWNSLTGQSYKNTSKALSELGLSKYGSTGEIASSAGNSSSNQLATINAIQQLKANSLKIKEESYNFNTSKRLGIRTDDNNVLASILPYAKILFGLGMEDVPDGGVVPYAWKWLKDKFASMRGGSGSNVYAGASTDAASSVAKDSAKAVSGFVDSRSVKDSYPIINSSTLDSTLSFISSNYAYRTSENGKLMLTSTGVRQLKSLASSYGLDYDYLKKLVAQHYKANGVSAPVFGERSLELDSRASGGGHAW